MCLRHPAGTSGAAKVLLFKGTGTAALYGPNRSWRVTFNWDVPDAVLLGAIGGLVGLSEVTEAS